jgi:uncharacterized NAD-dependent epimerase/dehydratase family protein
MINREKAVILAEKVFSSTYGKTAHGLVRYSERFDIVAVIDSQLAGFDAGEYLEGRQKGIPIVGTLEESLKFSPRYLIVGAATDGGVLPLEYKSIIKDAISKGLSIVNGLHDFVSDDPELSALAKEKGIDIIDVRKMFRDSKIPFTGEIENVKAFKIAVLGTDSALGKRTTTILLMNELRKRGFKTEMIGTGQTSWMQGIEYTTVIDATINDFVAGAIEHQVVRAWNEKRPDFILLEGQGSVVHPAYPGSFEIIAAGRPDAIILQDAPGRKYLDGFENYPMPDVGKVIQILELLSGKRVIAITLNTQNLEAGETSRIASRYEKKYRIPVVLPLQEIERLCDVVVAYGKQNEILIHR